MMIVAEDIGTGIVVDREIYQGDRGGAGKFVHMNAGERGAVACSCGNHDC